MHAVSEVALGLDGWWGKRGIRNEDALRDLYALYDGEALNVSFRELTGPLAADDGTHSLFPYPARLIRHIPRFLLHSGLVAEPDAEIIDPFCGSGTVLVEAQSSGRASFGIDSNPVAALVSRAKTMPTDTADFLSLTDGVVNRAKRARSGMLPPDFVRKWYTGPAISALARLSLSIEGRKDNSSYDLLRVVFALTCRDLSRRDPRIPVPVLSDHNGQVTTSDVWNLFTKHASRTAQRVARLPRNAAPASVAFGDSRASSAWSRSHTASPSVMVTSPPYGAAQKYVRSTSLEAAWLGFTASNGTMELERASIGRDRLPQSERNWDLHSLGDENLREFLNRVRDRNPLRSDIYANYFADMKRSFSQAAAHTSSLEKIVMIAGTNIVTGEHLDTHAHLADIIEALGFKRTLVLKDEIRGRTLMTTRRNGHKPASAEYVYFFEKRAEPLS